jgi:hypothetical protein
VAVTKDQLRRSAYSCWVKAFEDEGHPQHHTTRMIVYHDLLVKYGHLIPKVENDGGPRYACGWDPDPNRRAPGAV